MSMQDPNADLKQQFLRRLGAVPETSTHRPKIHVIRAPGRVNLIGEHTDYNDGFVLPMAIEPEVKIVCRSRGDGLVRLASIAFDGPIVEFSVEKRIERAEPKWANYSRGVAAELIAAGIPLTGMDALIANTLPVGGGLSSSAAIEVSTALAFLTLAGLKMDPARLAMLCQKAEHEYALAPVGIMDMTIVISAQADHAMLLDCRSQAKQFIPLDKKELSVVIANTMVRHELSDGEYARRREQCATAVEILCQETSSIRSLRDATLKQLDSSKSKMSDVIYRRARHVITENQRTTETASLLAKKMYEQAGQHMVQSHASLRDDYEVSCAELDFLVEQSMTIKGVYGARMTGGGFGGCIVALTQPRAVDPLAEYLRHTYQERFNISPAILTTSPAAAASVIE